MSLSISFLNKLRGMLCKSLCIFIFETIKMVEHGNWKKMFVINGKLFEQCVTGTLVQTISLTLKPLDKPIKAKVFRLRFTFWF